MPVQDLTLKIPGRMNRRSRWSATKAGKLASALMAIASLCSANSTASGDLLDDAKALQPSLGAKYDAAYAHVEMRGTDREVDNREPRTSFEESCAYFRNGDFIKKSVNIRQAQFPGLHPGREGVFSLCSDYCFQAGRPDASAKYVIDEFSPKPAIDSLRDRCEPLFASDYLDEIKVADLIASNYANAVSAEEVMLESRALVKVTTKVTFGEGGSAHWELYFLPRTWAFAGASRLFGKNLIEHRVAYESDDPLRLKSYMRWECSTDEPGVKRRLTEISINSIQFRQVPESEFRLASVGIEEPHPVRGSDGPSAWTFVGAGLFGAVGIGLAVLSVRQRRRRRAEAHPPNAG